MNDLGHAKTFRDLIVYRKARSVAKTIYEISRSFPREETYSLTDQIRRSSSSIGAQIAEAWAKRRYEKHFVAKLTDADAEQHETQHWVDLAEERAYLNSMQAQELQRDLSEIGRMLNSMIDKSHKFCSQDTYQTREANAEYFTDTTGN